MSDKVNNQATDDMPVAAKMKTISKMVRLLSIPRSELKLNPSMAHGCYSVVCIGSFFEVYKVTSVILKDNGEYELKGVMVLNRFLSAGLNESRLQNVMDVTKFYILTEDDLRTALNSIVDTTFSAGSFLN